MKGNGIEMIGLDDALKTLDPIAFDKSVIRSANEIITQGFNATKKNITQKFNISIATVKKIDGKASRGEFAFKSKFSGKINKRHGHIYVSKATNNKRYFDVNLKADPTSLYLFTPDTLYGQRGRTTSKVNLRTKVLKKSRMNKSDKNIFIARTGNGHIGIFQRSLTGAKMEKKNKAAIFERTLQPTSEMFDTISFVENVGNAMTKSFHKRFQHNWKYYHAK